MFEIKELTLTKNEKLLKPKMKKLKTKTRRKICVNINNVKIENAFYIVLCTLGRRAWHERIRQTAQCK